MLSILLAAAAAAGFNASTPDALTPRSVRFELVYRVATLVCPRMAAQGKQHSIKGLFAETNRVLKRRTYLTGNELLLLINNCMIYEQGRSGE